MTDLKPRKCRHEDAIQTTRTNFQWCPDCGSAKYDRKTSGGETVCRWEPPRNYRGKPGRKVDGQGLSASSTDGTKEKAKGKLNDKNKKKSSADKKDKGTPDRKEPQHEEPKPVETPNKDGRRTRGANSSKRVEVRSAAKANRKPAIRIETIEPKRARRTKAQMAEARLQAGQLLERHADGEQAPAIN